MRFNELANLLESSTKSKMIISTVDGSKRWINAAGQLHREDGPARVTTDGDKIWYKNGQMHREDGPAITQNRDQGYQAWYINDIRHREDGPARIWGDGQKQWWINGKQITEEEFNKIKARQEALQSTEHGTDLTF